MRGQISVHRLRIAEKFRWTISSFGSSNSTRILTGVPSDISSSNSENQPSYPSMRTIRVQNGCSISSITLILNWITPKLCRSPGRDGAPRREGGLTLRKAWSTEQPRRLAPALRPWLIVWFGHGWYRIGCWVRNSLANDLIVTGIESSVNSMKGSMPP